MNTQHAILLVEDDPNFGKVLKSYLEVHGYAVDLVADGARAIGHFRRKHYSLCILDVMLPHRDGFDIAREIRLINKTIPLFFLTAKGMVEDVLQGFSMGADDYLVKPFDSEILLCKIKAIIRRHTTQMEEHQQEEYQIGKYLFNITFRTLRSEDGTQKLSPKETALLELLCRNMNSITLREEALKTIWGDDSYFTTRSMDVYMTKLRRYLKHDPKVEITNILGNGYILSVQKKT
jgi:two-component system, OmpR family, response regulator